MEYFYRGNVEVGEIFEDPEIGKQKDLKEVLNLLKQAYNTDIIMRLPNEDLNFAVKKEKDTFTHKTISEYELDEEARFINEQLEELMDRVTSESSLTANDDLKLISCKSFHPIQNVRSITDLHTLVKNSVNPMALQDLVTTFNFSKLDDGPYGKASVIGCNHVEKALSKQLLVADVNRYIEVPEQPHENFTKDISNTCNYKNRLLYQ